MPHERQRAADTAHLAARRFRFRHDQRGRSSTPASTPLRRRFRRHRRHLAFGQLEHQPPRPPIPTGAPQLQQHRLDLHRHPRGRCERSLSPSRPSASYRANQACNVVAIAVNQIREDSSQRSRKHRLRCLMHSKTGRAGKSPEILTDPGILSRNTVLSF
jgi:hypothetical protein